ncbi:hypothetical protein LJC58_08335, partial [Lachnospiraceae bacterium OttesenSCG-928-D06]|nr:hypothetical protein [Lachnospiraceae bacterium OttesenSCG-928-D06]
MKGKKLGRRLVSLFLTGLLVLGDGSAAKVFAETISDFRQNIAAQELQEVQDLQKVSGGDALLPDETDGDGILGEDSSEDTREDVLENENIGEDTGEDTDENSAEDLDA